MKELQESEKQEIKEMIAGKLGMDVEKIGDESTLVNDLGADSLDVVDIVVELEKIYDISIPDDEWSQEMTMQDLYKIVSLRIN